MRHQLLILILSFLGSHSTLRAKSIFCNLSGEVELKGNLLNYIEDDEKLASSKEGFILVYKEICQIELKKGKQIENNKQINSGSRVKVKGKIKNGQLIAQNIKVISEENPRSTPTVEKMLLVKFEFSDLQLECTNTQISTRMFDGAKSVKNFYSEASEGEKDFEGEFTKTYQLQIAEANCKDVSSWTNELNRKLVADGYNLLDYERIFYFFPKPRSCRWMGRGTLGGLPSLSWISRCKAKRVYAHELGHNFGLWHASTPRSNYGDKSDVMGVGNFNPPNAPHMAQLGWREPQSIQEITENGEFTLTGLEKNSRLAEYPQIYKIKSVRENRTFYFSYRLAEGFASGMSPNYLGGINIHFQDGSRNTYFTKRMQDNEEFTNALRDFKIKQISHDESKVNFRIQLLGIQN